MTEKEYIDKLRLRESDHEASNEILALADKSVEEHPRSASLWCRRGDLIQLGSSESSYELNDSLESYKKAREIDPLDFEAHESIGYFYDLHLENYLLAEKSFRNAVELGGGIDSYYGLARLLAELNRTDEAISLLEPENCPYHDEADIKEIRDEISDGFWAD